jgi:hypothetical protein
MLSNTWTISDEIWTMSKFHISELKCKSNCGLILHDFLSIDQSTSLKRDKFFSRIFFATRSLDPKSNSPNMIVLRRKGPIFSEARHSDASTETRLILTASESAISCQKCTPVELRCSWSRIEAKKKTCGQQQKRV